MLLPKTLDLHRNLSPKNVFLDVIASLELVLALSIEDVYNMLTVFLFETFPTVSKSEISF